MTLKFAFKFLLNVSMMVRNIIFNNRIVKIVHQIKFGLIVIQLPSVPIQILHN